MNKCEPLKIDPWEAAGLIQKLDGYLSALYPAESNHLESIEDLGKDNVRMFGNKIGDQIVCIGAVKLMDTYGELKRVYASPEFRGRKLASGMMAVLESEIKKNNLDFARLETGIHQPEALSLFKKNGYVPCSPFGDYVEDPLSIFMEKKLGG